MQRENRITGGDFHGRNIIKDVGDIVSKIDPDFGQGVESVLPKRNPTIEEIAASIFFDSFPTFGSDSASQTNAKFLRNVFPFWQKTQNELLSHGDLYKQLLANTIARMNLSSLASFADSQLHFFGQQNPPDESELLRWMNVKTVTDLATYDVVSEAGSVVTEYDSSFGEDFELVPLEQKMTMHEVAAYLFLDYCTFTEEAPDEKNVDLLRFIFPNWQKEESENCSNGDDMQKLLAEAITEIKISDLAAFAKSESCFLEEQKQLSKDSNIMPLDEEILLHWRNAARITALATSQD